MTGSTHSNITNLFGNDGTDVINVRTIAGDTTVNGGNHSDTINVGSNAQGTVVTPNDNAGGIVDGIAALLTVNGDAPTEAGSDILNVDDTGDSNDNVGNLTNTSITGLDMAGSISYGTIETLNIALSAFDDEFTIESTHSNITNLFGNDGTDVINVRTIAGDTTVNGGNHSDTINVGSNAQGTVVTPNDNAGGIVDGIAALLTVNGDAPTEAGSDILNVDDTGDSNDNVGNLTNTSITGLDMAGSITYGTIETLNIALSAFDDEFTIESTHSNITNLYGNDGTDVFNLRTIAGDTNVYGGNQLDTFNVGSNAQGTVANPYDNFDGNVNGISALLTLVGGSSGSDRDWLTVDDTGDALDNTGVLTSSRLTGLGMGNSDQSIVESSLGIDYSEMEDLEIALGSGSDTFTINSTHNVATAGTTETTWLQPI